MEYSYPEIRDVFTICAEAVAPDPRTNRGYIRPRSDGMGKILQNILSMNGVEFELKPGGLSIVSGANVQEIFFDLGQNEAIDATVNEISEDLDLPMRVNRLFRRAANYNPEAERARREKEQAAIDMLKNIIIKIEFDIRSSDGGKYNYFYFPTDKLTTAEAAFNTLGMFTQRHTTHLDGRVATVLRYPATMLSGNELTVIHELNKAVRSRRMERNRDAFDRGTADVHGKASIDELKKLIKFIDNVYYTNDPNHHYYYLYFNDIDRAFDIMSELGVRDIEKYYSSSKKTYVLRLDQDKVSPVAQNIITELQREIATRGINYSNNMGGRFKI